MFQDYNNIKGKMEKKAEDFKEFERQDGLGKAWRCGRCAKKVPDPPDVSLKGQATQK